MVRNQPPTIKQIKALKYRSQGNSMRKSLILAGYSMAVANKSTQFLKHKGVQNALLSLKEHVLNKGVTTEKIADKFKEWIDAEKVQTSHTEPDYKVPDYDTQVKAYDRWKDVMDMGEQPNGIKRKLTIEEFINDEEVTENSRQ